MLYLLCSLEDMDSAIAGGSCNAPIALTENPNLDLSTCA